VHADEASKDLEKRNAALNEELNALDNENATLKATLAELGVKIEENTALNEEEEEKAKAIADKLAVAREEEAGLTQLNVNDITAYNTAMSDVNHIQENIERVNNELGGLENEENELKRTKADSINELSERERAIERAREKAERLERKIIRCDKSIEELQGISAEMTKQNKSFFELSENLSERISALDKEEFRLKAANEKLAEAIDYNIRYMWEEYELTISSAKELVIDTGDTEATKKNIQELRSKIRGLGDVNVNAIEEYRETSERYEFLKTQRDDIVKAEKVLEGIIEELDVDMRKQFLLTFDEIGKRFDHTFKELFGGGKGTLELTEDEDVLEAGIKIIAQPPGKKLQNMMQLSGGEKALTAIALLFAILDLKPSPFCLLDEIEAALDDSNVSRFANYLQKLTSNTQFIVITHRRGTMAAADALYGITMQEKGVSTLVSVNLVESALK
jgi:chromosome segregation protein